MTPTPHAGEVLTHELEALLSCRSLREASILTANAAGALGDAGQAVVWITGAWGSARVTGIAGLSVVQRHNDFTNWFEAAAPFAKARGEGHIAFLNDPFATPRLERDRHQYLQQYTLHLPLKSPQGVIFGGVFVTRAHPLSELQLNTLTRYLQAAANALWNTRQRLMHRKIVGGGHAGWRWTLLLGAAAIGSLFIPVRLSATASAEISPRDAMPITAPQDGVIEKLLVRPNELISPGTLLVRYNETVDKNRLMVAQQNLAVARAELDRTTSKSFQDPSSRAELGTFRAKVQEKATEARFLEQMLERLVIRAPLGGAAIFADADEWVGRPVQKGERIMLLADTEKIWITLFISPEEAIPDISEAPVKLNLDIAPLTSLQAKVEESSYESVVMPDGRVGYLLRASLLPGQPPPRIGLRGVATVYGERTVLGYYLFRKPIRSLRRMFGL